MKTVLKGGILTCLAVLRIAYLVIAVVVLRDWLPVPLACILADLLVGPARLSAVFWLSQYSVR